IPPPPHKSKSASPQSQDVEPLPRDLFDSPTADFVLHCLDGVTLRVHSTILSFASPVLAKLIADHAATASGQTNYRPAELHEDGHILGKVLEYVYPCPQPAPPASLERLKTLLEAAHKYQLDAALAALRTSL
ncbi:hypothetical protein BD310DRAFT_842258, partial [Dichomitus squalens]